MEPTYNDEGHIIKLKGKLSGNKEIAFTKYDGKGFLHITDLSKTWVNGKLNRQLAKTVTLRMDQMEKLYDLIQEISLYADQMGLSKVIYFNKLMLCFIKC